MTIYKYPLPLHTVNKVEMHRNSYILTCQMQGDVPCLWAVVDPALDMVERTFRIFGTGWTLPDGFDYGNYIGTVQDRYGYVWHIFEDF